MDTETRALVEAVECCNFPLSHLCRALLTVTDNTCIYHDLVPINELGQHPGIYLVTPTHIQLAVGFPEYIRLSLICTTLSHRISLSGTDTGRNALAKPLYQFRGIIIRSLRKDIEVRQNRNVDLLIAGIIAILLSGVSSNGTLIDDSY